MHLTETNAMTFTGRELSDDELLEVSGGNSAYNNALTVAAGFVGVAAATVGMPVVAGAFALGSISASAIAIFAAFNDDHKSQQ